MFAKRRQQLAAEDSLRTAERCGTMHAALFPSKRNSTPRAECA
jgi:hypothetical protein